MRGPLTPEGRQTLIYLIFAGCGPALTGVVIWAMLIIRTWSDASAEIRLDKFAQLAMVVAAALMIIVIGLACFVSIRAIKAKVGEASFEATGSGGDNGGAQVTATATVIVPNGEAQ
jgi:hypothetical protein